MATARQKNHFKRLTEYILISFSAARMKKRGMANAGKPKLTVMRK